jgi:hypothetical protein
MSEARRDRFENANAFMRNLRTDAIAAENDDACFDSAHACACS